MANVITQFLIGIGYDYDDKGERQAKAGMEAIKSSTLAIGAALSAAAIGAGVRVDQLAEKSRQLQDSLYRTNTPTTWVQGYQASLRELGQDADTAGGRVIDIEKQLAAIKMGDAGFLDSLGRAGFDTGALSQAKSAQDFITQASEQFSRATHTQQVNMANVLGLTDQEFKLWQQGGQYVNAHSKQLADQLGYTEALNQQQYEYSQSWVELNLELDKAGNTISTIMLPGMTSLVKLANEYVGAFNNFSRDNPEITKSAIGVGTGASIAGAGALLSRLPGLSALAPVITPVTTVVGGGIAASEGWDSIMDYSDRTYGKETTGGGNFKQNSPIGKAYNWGVNFFTADKPERPVLPPSLIQRSVDVPEKVYPVNYWDEKPTSGDQYTPYNMTPVTNDYERQNEHLAKTLRESPIRVDNKVTMQGTVELDGQKVGDIIDTRIDEHNQQALPSFDTQVSR